MLTTWVPTFPASSTKSTAKVMTPAGSLDSTALDSNLQSIDAPGGFVVSNVAVTALLPIIVTLEDWVVIFSLPVMRRMAISPSPATALSKLSDLISTDVNVGASLS